MDLRRFLADTRPLSNTHFRRLWTANIITVTGAQLTVVAVPAQIYSLTNSSGMVGLAGLFGLIPLLVFGLWGGALADHMDRRRLLIGTTLGLIATSLCFWIQAALDVHNPWLLLAIFSLQQAFFAINQPTRSAILGTLLPHEQLPAANSLNMTVMMAGAIGGPTGGGTAFAILFAAIPLGAVIGGAFSGWVSHVHHHGRAVLLSVGGWGIGIIAFGASAQLADRTAQPWLIPAAAALAVAGAADMFSAAFRQSMLQSAVEDNMRGRLQGVFIVVVAGGPRIADILHGVSADYLDAATVSLGGGVLVLVGTAVVALAAPSFRAYDARSL